ncbi:hypothetical protein DICPUDRAFT_76605 [Dictyostelium purpureum]|uniref:DUSP domain-containing protein n=1 Tax=Dictyostelium purpureum TaxID=5786 RepID=F0ZE38_DICPU|nr:uncharacterized protein DICPUDRAFT_76605 [Dictyostelium purpureum]EGC37821.1 hypothetical protein DICPUDRAFT_76605 [Dictyostelium purpureum]|eukprot:XP_003285666.1 hypothetical protein DICPUDRAFT_76605 [Dictyostelium purpureum]
MSWSYNSNDCLNIGNFYNGNPYETPLNSTRNNINSYNDNNNIHNSKDNLINNNCSINNDHLYSTDDNSVPSSPNNSDICRLGLMLKKIPDDQLDEETKLKIRMIKNEILSLTNNVNNNNNSNNNNDNNNDNSNNNDNLHNLNNSENLSNISSDSINTNLGGLRSILKDIPDDQIVEEQNLMIKMIKNEILSLTNSIKANNIPPKDYDNININSYNDNNKDNIDSIDNSNNNIDNIDNIDNMDNINQNSNINRTENKNININNLDMDMDMDIYNNTYQDVPNNENSYNINIHEILKYHSQLEPPPPQQLSMVQQQLEKQLELNDIFFSEIILYDDLTKDQINQLLSTINSTPKFQYNEWALVNQTWFSEWEKGIFRKDELGPIDNYPLLDITSDDDQLLRCDIKEYLDFTVVPIDIWNIFKKIYGGSPDIIRKVTDKGDIDLKIPITLFLIKSSDIKYCQYITKSHAFQYETFFSLKKRACKLFNIPFGDADIYNFDGGTATQELYLFLTPRTIKLYNNQMILVKEKKYPLESESEPESTPTLTPTPTLTSSIPNTPNIDFTLSSISSMPSVDFNNDSKVLESGTSVTPSPNNQKQTMFTRYINKKTNSNYFYFPLYTDPFSLSFLNYSFFKSSFNYDPDSILQSNEYVQFEKMQNNYYSNLDQIQSFSFNSDKDENKNDDNNNIKSNNKNNTNNIENNINNINNIDNNNNNENSPKNYIDNMYFHGIDLEEENPKKAHRPPVCKPQ